MFRPGEELDRNLGSRAAGCTAQDAAIVTDVLGYTMHSIRRAIVCEVFWVDG